MQITITVSPTELLEVLSGINADIRITVPKKQPTAAEIPISEDMLDSVMRRAFSGK